MDDQRVDREGGWRFGCLIAAFVAVALISSAFGYCIGMLNEHGICNEDMSIRLKQARDGYEKQISELKAQQK
jgi:hypothetical protein